MLDSPALHHDKHMSDCRYTCINLGVTWSGRLHNPAALALEQGPQHPPNRLGGDDDEKCSCPFRGSNTLPSVQPSHYSEARCP